MLKVEASNSNEIETVQVLIEHLAKEHAGRTCLISPETGKMLSFSDLKECAECISNWLYHLGLEQGDKVAFLMENGLFTVQLFLGTMYGGFVSVPLNVRAGVSTLSYTLDHCDAKVVFVESQYTALLKEILANVDRPIQIVPADVDSLASVQPGQLATQPKSPPKVEEVALLMYSSGSTGQPKAAMHTHRTLLAHGKNSISSHQLGSADRSLLVLPLYHINAECVTLIPTLLSGGSVVVPHHFNVSEFWEWLEKYQCTWSAVVPTIISQLLDWKDPRANSREAAFKRIRFLRSSSAPLSPSLHQEFLNKFKLLLIQAMGSTEAGNIFSNPLPPGENKIGSPGLPWGFETRIIAREGVEMPPGEPGEVLIRGPALMLGYYKDPEGTAAVLDSDGWYHTGDLAYRDEDGYFFVVGRARELVIKGGMNIAPKQIDEVLESHPSILEAAAVGVPDRHVGEDIVAFAVPRSGMTGNESDLLAFCESRLGHFKSPTRIFFVKDLPKGPSGKVQRLKLQEKAIQFLAAGTVAPSGEDAQRVGKQATSNGTHKEPTPIEQTIAKIWTELLSQPHVDLRANFFALGGHSLLAIQFLSRLREKLPIALSLSDFFGNASVAELAALIRKRLRLKVPSSTDATAVWETDLLQQCAPAATAEKIPARDRSQPCPLSPAQERIWFLEQLSPGVPIYNESEAVRILGELDTDIMEQALNAIISQQEILRTTIQVVDGQPRAEVHERWPLMIKRIDLRQFPDGQREAELERLLVKEPQRLFRLDGEPGIRTTIIQLAPQEHVFILIIHHIICDRLSVGILWRELGKLYVALVHRQPLSPRLPLPVQYGDYASWQRRRIQEADFERDLAFWRKYLQGAPKVLDLPADRPRPNAVTYQGNKRRFRLDRTLSNKLRELGRREQTSLYNVFAATLNILLHRYTGQEDILLGLPIADRERPEFQPLIGFFIDTLVLRTNIHGNPTFQEFLKDVQRGLVDIYSHRNVPFERIVAVTQPERDLSHSPLFQVMLNWRDRDAQPYFIGLPGLTLHPLLAQSKVSKFDLSIFLTDAAEEIWLELEYSTDLFAEDRIVRMVGHYEMLLEGITANPEERILALSLLTEAERRQLLVEWNRTDLPYPKDRCLHELFEEQVERTPTAAAVEFEQQHLTYQELNERANQMAHHLQKLGVGPEVLVAVCMERSLEMIVALLGILKAGGAYVPMDPAYPKDRLALMMADTEIELVLTQQALKFNFPQDGLMTICLDTDWPQIQRESQESAAVRVLGENLAYVLYTSGSTGRPKGVAMRHRPLCNLISWQLENSHPNPARTLQFASLNFDVSFQEIFSTLSCGGALVLVSEVRRQEPAELLHYINAKSIERIFLPFVALQQLAETAESHNLVPGSLREVITAGEQLRISPQILWLFERLTQCRLHNQYGPTESHVVTAYTLSGLTGQWPALPPIGRPIANARIYLLDHNLQPVPLGIGAELYIGGDVLASGYLNRPDLTAEKFIADPFSEDPTARLYRTGDLARYLPDGNIEYLGRLDHQVKIRGFRIELGEIETHLNQHPAVGEVVVVAREDTPGNKRLVAYMISKNGESPTALELRELLKLKLPDYMVPSAFIRLDQFPLTPNGKVDRKALPKPEYESELSEFILPRTPTEVSLAKIWCEVLGVKQVGLCDNFFDLGGHSLLATRLTSRVADVFTVKLSLRAVFKHPSLMDLARHIDILLWARSGAKVAAVDSAGTLVEGKL